MFQPIYIIGFSGNRPSEEPGRSVEEIEGLAPTVQRAFQRFRESIADCEGQIEVFCGAAEGADILICELAIQAGIPIHIILPKNEEAFRTDFNDESSWLRAEAIIRHAREGVGGSTFRVAAVRGSGSSCYEVANAAILEASDAMLFLWNGRETNKQGGTGEFIKQTKALRMPHIVLNTLAPGEIEATDLEQLCRWDMPDNGRSVFDFLRKEVSGRANGTFSEVWERLEDAAGRSSKRFRFSMTTSILMHGGGALVAGLAVTYASQLKGSYAFAVLSGVELFMVGLALAIMLWHAHRHTRQTWIKCRFASELMRSFHSCAGVLDPLHPNIRRHAPKWQRFALTAFLCAHRERASPSHSMDELKQRYVSGRVEDQKAYFIKQFEKAAPKSAFFHKVGTWTSWGALVFVAFAFAFKLIEASEGKTPYSHGSGLDLKLLAKYFMFYFLPVALPLIAGISNSLANSLDITRRQIRYREMADLFEKQKDYILTINDAQVLEQTILKIEEMLLDEQIEWMGAAMSGSGH